MSKATPYTRTTREGDILTVARPAEIGASTEDGAWVTFCEKHSTLVYSDTKALALDTRGIDFCDDCRDGKPAADAEPDTDGPHEYVSTSDAMDMSEVFEAEALGAEAVAELDSAVERNDEEVRILTALEAARDAGNRDERRALIREARAAGIAGARVAESAGVSLTYVYDVANGNVRSTPALREFQKGYQEALADIAAIINTAPTLEVGYATVAEWITNNRLAAAEAIFARALAERQS
jgi:hypothetical protein